jgi:hypothetical protein
VLVMTFTNRHHYNQSIFASSICTHRRKLRYCCCRCRAHARPHL